MDYLALKKMKIKYKFSAKISMKRQRNCGFKMQFLDILSSYICYCPILTGLISIYNIRFNF